MYRRKGPYFKLDSDEKMLEHHESANFLEPDSELEETARKMIEGREVDMGDLDRKHDIKR
jgi:hypothetical protein